MKIWIKSGDQEVGPGTEEQFLSAYRAGRINNSSVFRLDEDETWKHLAEFPPACSLALESEHWYWIKDGAISTTQVGPTSGSSLLKQRTSRVNKRTPVLNPIFTQGEWVEFGSTLLETAYQNNEAAEKTIREEQKKNKLLQKEQAKEAKKQEKQRKEAARLAQQEAMLQAQQREREEALRLQAQRNKLRQQYENEFQAARKNLSPSARQWITKATNEDFWVRKDVYHLRAYVDAYLVGNLAFCTEAKELVVGADQHDNFLGAKRNLWYAIYLSAEAKYGHSPNANLTFQEADSTTIWDGMSCYALRAIFELLCEHYPNNLVAAKYEYEKHHQHDAWLCSHYYTMRAIITLLNGKIEDHQRYRAYFEDIESNYEVWQALVSRTIELFVEVNIFDEKIV